MIIESKIKELDLKNKRVFLRVDLNVEIMDQKILDDFKLTSILPTLNLLIEKGAKIILATHIGNPNLNSAFDNNLSTRTLLPWFKNKGYKIEFEYDLEIANYKSHNIKNGMILLLENLRFYKGEKAQDLEFANKLKILADYYVSDAFGTIHRADTSVNLLPKQFNLAHKTIGLLIEKEIRNLMIIKNNIKQNLGKSSIAILAGGKVKDKLPLISPLLDIFDKILIGPALVFTFLKAKKINIGKSLILDNLIEIALDILNKAKEKNKKIIFPIDYQVLDTPNYVNIANFIEYLQYNLDKIKNIEEFKDNYIGLSIGPRSIELFNSYIESSDIIFLNGAMGFSQAPKTLDSFDKILRSISKSQSFSVIAGGDSVAQVHKNNLQLNIDFCSTGGGATLAYLANIQLLGLDNIIS